MKRLILTSLCVLFFAGTALADWNLGDPNKWVQLPDPTGWDVAFNQSGVAIADDWLCTDTGPVKDIHLWFSWKGDNVGKLTSLSLDIYDNNPSGPGGFSIPGNYRWGKIFPIDDSAQRLYGEGLQGWLNNSYNEESGQYNTTYDLQDHIGIYQVNLTDLANPFVQQAGQIYWLMVNCAWWEGGGTAQAHPGWKTSNNDWGDNAVWLEAHYQGESVWRELVDPVTGDSLNLAFVITPEPATVALLGLGALSLLRRKRSVWIRQAHYK
jgi:hypothetical protein